MEQEVDQYAALAWRERAGRREYLLVTSRRTGRWIFPKGNAAKDEDPAAAALREAAEEAGVDGLPGRRPIGRYQALKVSEERTRALTVELWPVEIRALADDYPEAEHRTRRLVPFEEACALLGQPDMRALLERFHALRTG